MTRPQGILNNKSVALTVLIVALIAAVFYVYSSTSEIPAIVQDSVPMVCGDETKLCFDGSAVHRIGVNCEFAECPIQENEEVKNSTVASLDQKILHTGVFITPLEVVTDSRCPIDVTCVWAGEVSLRVSLEAGRVQDEVILKLHTPMFFENNEITLTNVAPENNSMKPFGKEEYLFTFNVTPKETSEATVSKGSCYRGGCSGQLCTDQSDAVSTCEYREEYACYQTAVCERQTNGACGWSETTSLLACLGKQSQ